MVEAWRDREDEERRPRRAEINSDDRGDVWVVGCPLSLCGAELMSQSNQRRTEQVLPLPLPPFLFFSFLFFSFNICVYIIVHVAHPLPSN